MVENSKQQQQQMKKKRKSLNKKRGRRAKEKIFIDTMRVSLTERAPGDDLSFRMRTFYFALHVVEESGDEGGE